MQSTAVPCPKSIMVLFSVQSEDVLQAERGKQRIPKSAFECLSQRNKILTNLRFKVAHYIKDSPFYELTSQYCHFVKLILLKWLVGYQHSSVVLDTGMVTITSWVRICWRLLLQYTAKIFWKSYFHEKI